VSSANGSSNGLLPEGAALGAGYEVIDHLSRSRSLDVYDAWSLERDCRCVAKMVRPDRSGPRRRDRLVREGELLLGLSHPHFVRAYELVHRPRTVLILETLDGETVEHMIESATRRLALVDVAQLGLHLCSAIRYLHGQGFLHLDLKPSNLIAQNGQTKVIDLSLSRRPGPGPRGAGTPAYMAPEQASGGRMSEATDVWGIGATLYEAATGLRPFPDAGRGGYPQLERRAASVAESRRAPAPFTKLIGNCLEPDPAGRPMVSELTQSLDELIGS
jgi:eukaryotic-like serine/threonine-protein kinase